jgi:hypothetical protein
MQSARMKSIYLITVTPDAPLRREKMSMAVHFNVPAKVVRRLP